MPARERRHSVRVLLVLWDTQGEEERTQRLAQAIAEYGEPFPLSQSSYLLYTGRSSDDVFESLKHQLGAQNIESLLVLSVPQPYTGRAPTKVRLWLEQLKEKRPASSATRSRQRDT